MTEKYVPDEDRDLHPYLTERETPIEEIPPENRYMAKLPGGGEQVLDTRLCYNLGPNGRYNECGSVASDAARDSD